MKAIYFLIPFLAIATACSSAGKLVTEKDGWFNVDASSLNDQTSGLYYCSKEKGNKPVCETPEYKIHAPLAKPSN